MERLFKCFCHLGELRDERIIIFARFRFGGKYVPETLIPALTELEEEYKKAMADPSFQVSPCALHDVACWHVTPTHPWLDDTPL